MAEADTIGVEFAAEPWPWIASVVLDGEAVLYDEQTGRVHLMNAPGTIVWQLLDGATSVAEIADAIAAASGTAHDTVTLEVVSLVRMLADLGVIVGFEPRAVEPPPSCGDALDRLGWATSDTFDVGTGRLRIRTNSSELGPVIRALFPERLVEDVDGGGFAYSIRLEAPTEGRQAMHVLYEDCTVVRRSRDPMRILRLLVAHVDGREQLQARGPLRLAGTVAVGMRGVALLPLALEADLARVERRMNAAGLHLVDMPFATFDQLTAELVVADPPAVDEHLLDGIDLYRGHEPGPAPPGRHRVRGWLLDDLRGADDRRRPAMKLVLNSSAITRDRARRLVAKIQDNATLIARWYPWPEDLVGAVVRLAEGRR